MSALKLSDPLSVDDVEVRIGTTSAKGFSLLLYKTARTDVRRLDEVFPMAWKNRFFRDEKGLLCCEISVYSNEIKEWISRVDVGTESFTEADKGSYSDAFKRAGFKWNIGTELYNSPFVWINWEMMQKGNSHVPKGFYSSSISIDRFEVENGHVVGLSISYGSKGEIYKHESKTSKKLFKHKEERNNYVAQIVTAINDKQQDSIKELWIELNREQQQSLWSEFGSSQQTYIRESLV